MTENLRMQFPYLLQWFVAPWDEYPNILPADPLTNIHSHHPVFFKEILRTALEPLLHVTTDTRCVFCHAPIKVMHEADIPA